MAAAGAGNLNKKNNTQFAQLENVKLTENDIPGASLGKQDPKQLTVKQLKFWLSCRGARTSGKKDELVARVENYNKIPELRDNIVDPDPDKVFTKSKIENLACNKENELGIPSTSDEFLNFPTSDGEFSEDLRILPSFNPGDLYTLAKNSGKNSKKYSHLAVVDKPVDKGFFMKNLVHDLQTCKKENTVYIRALCWASMTKSVEYQVKLVVNGSKSLEKIKCAQCDPKCPASKSGCCCHVMATVWLLDEYSRLNLTETPPSSVTISRTSKPQAWGIPSRKRIVVHKPVMETNLCRPKHVTENEAKKRKQGLVCNLFDPRPFKRRCLDVDGLKRMNQKLQEKTPTVPYAKVLDQNQEIEVVTTVVGVVAKGSLLHMQLNDDDLQPALNQGTVTPNDDRISYPCLPITCIDTDQCVADAPTLSLSNCHEIFRNTLEQSKSVIWKQERQCRLTASRFGPVIKRKTDYTDSFVKSICNPPDISQIPCVKFGIENENMVAELYKETLNSEGKAVELFDVGLCVNPSLPYLGASLDRGVYDHSCESKYGGLEVKTCFKAGRLGISVQEAVDHPECKSEFFLHEQNNTISLKHDHNYYYQVQGQLALTTLPWVDFVAYSGFGSIYRERVYFDRDLWETKMLPKLNDFYLKNRHFFEQGPCS